MEKTNHMKVECYSKKTIKSYRRYTNEFICFAKGDLSQDYIIPYLTYLAEKESQPATINVAKSAIMYLFPVYY